MVEKGRVGRSVLVDDVGFDYMWKIDSTLTCSTYVAMNTISTMIQFTLHFTVTSINLTALIRPHMHEHLSNYSLLNVAISSI